jgi:zinc transport system substrate-binding protein
VSTVKENRMRHVVAVLGLAAVLAGSGCGKKDKEGEKGSPAPAPSAGTGSGSGGSGGSGGPPPTESAPLTVGVTLHPYYSWTANVLDGIPNATVVALLPSEIDAGSYQPATDDVAKISKLDAIVVNGLGHDAFITDMIKASGNTKVVVIDANAETPTVKGMGGEAVNAHTFISFTNAIQQSAYIAKKLGELRPAAAEKMAANAEAYGDRLAALRTAAAEKLAKASIERAVTVHDGYTYLLQEFGIELAGVVEPSHGLTPSAKELTDMIALMKKGKVTVVFTEETFPDKLLAMLKEGTGASVYVISHVAMGTYAKDEFEAVMKANADVLVKALVDDPAAAPPKPTK